MAEGPAHSNDSLNTSSCWKEEGRILIVESTSRGWLLYSGQVPLPPWPQFSHLKNGCGTSRTGWQSKELWSLRSQEISVGGAKDLRPLPHLCHLQDCTLHQASTTFLSLPCGSSAPRARHLGERMDSGQIHFEWMWELYFDLFYLPGFCI